MWQITELLSEVRVNYDKTVVIQHLLRKLYEVVQNVPEQEVTWETTKDAPLVKAVPISESEAQKLKFKFAPPEDVLVLGSYLLRTVAKPVLNIDVGIELPKVPPHTTIQCHPSHWRLTIPCVISVFLQGSRAQREGCAQPPLWL